MISGTIVLSVPSIVGIKDLLFPLISAFLSACAGLRCHGALPGRGAGGPTGTRDRFFFFLFKFFHI